MPVLLTRRSTLPNAVERPLDGLRAVVGVAGVAGDRDRVVRPAERGHRLRERFGLAGGEADPRPLGDQPFGDAEPDAPAGAGDDGRLACESLHVILRRRMARIVAG